ncbi:MAG: 50S ribosomal protein L3 [Candidatus Ranarchaeia archaeon]
MGHRKQTSPHRGSLAYSPRKRAKSVHARVRAWPIIDDEKPCILGFGGYKVGNTHVVYRENRPNNPYLGHERTMGVTIIEVPPMAVTGIRAYKETPYGVKAANEVLAKPVSKSVQKYITRPEDYDLEAKKEEFLSNIGQYSDIRVLLASPPALTNVGQKKPILHEYGVSGGDIQSQINHIFDLFGADIQISDIFKEGEYVDIIAITKGKGFQGPIKRWGVKTLQHKSRKTVRGVGTLGPWRPARIMHTVPRAGQIGTHGRTEYNKLILKIGQSGRDISPKGGYNKYGIVKSSYILLAGSVQGPPRHFIRLRTALRPSKKIADAAPELVYIAATSE